MKQERIGKSALIDRKKNNETMKDMLFEKIPQILLRDTLQKSEDIFARLEDEDQIPPSISRGALDKILGTVPLRCMCVDVNLKKTMNQTLHG